MQTNRHTEAKSNILPFYKTSTSISYEKLSLADSNGISNKKKCKQDLTNKTKAMQFVIQNVNFNLSFMVRWVFRSKF